MENEKVLDCEKARQLNPLVLAFVGDAVMSLFVRTRFLTFDFKVNKLNKIVSNKVNAKAQAEAFLKIENDLLDEEKEIAMRARNTNMHHIAKNFSVMEYRYATALEAVIGFLYLVGKTERLNEILDRCL